MLEITPSTARPELPLNQIREARGAGNRPAQNPPAERMFDEDRVELSPGAQEHEAAADIAASQRVGELRSRIAAGTYLTPDKIDYVVDRLREELFGRPDAA